MNPHLIFGIFQPGDSLIHRLPVWAKYVFMLGGGVAPFLVGRWWFSLAALVGVVAALLATRIPATVALRLPGVFIIMMGALALYHGLSGSWERGVGYVMNVTTAIFVARMLTMTTPVSTMIDAIATGIRPIRLVGGNPENVALAIALMWRTIPYILGVIADLRDAMRARGMRTSWRILVPIIVKTVGHGLATADALKARGLDSSR